MSLPVCVVIPAFNAERTVARAVVSALAEPEVMELIVVDDCSSDRTADAAIQAAQGSERFSLLQLERNHGPSAARNFAISASRAPLIAILDSDDFLLPGRFSRLLARHDWDFVADNIVFLSEEMVPIAPPLQEVTEHWHQLSLGEFIAHNISERGRSRNELGFLKPVMRRAALERLALRYDEQVRLGEDYLLYARALAKGASFWISQSCGYVAIERSDSLSGMHRTHDLAQLLDRAAELLPLVSQTSREATLLRRHMASVRAKYDHRRFLDDKAASGMLTALAPIALRPKALFGVATAVLQDKLSSKVVRPKQRPRLLFTGTDFAASAGTGIKP